MEAILELPIIETLPYIIAVIWAIVSCLKICMMLIKLIIQKIKGKDITEQLQKIENKINKLKENAEKLILKTQKKE
jgi:hypothetical protein